MIYIKFQQSRLVFLSDPDETSGVKEPMTSCT